MLVMASLAPDPEILQAAEYFGYYVQQLAKHDFDMSPEQHKELMEAGVQVMTWAGPRWESWANQPRHLRDDATEEWLSELLLIVEVATTMAMLRDYLKHPEPMTRLRVSELWRKYVAWMGMAVRASGTIQEGLLSGEPMVASELYVQASVASQGIRNELTGM